MPFYEYECTNCGYQDEVLQKVTDKPLTQCPACGKSTLKKLMSAPVFRLKGSGWYETDFKSEQENKRNLVGGDDNDKNSDQGKTDDKAGEKDSGDVAAKGADAKAGDAKGTDPTAGDAKPADGKSKDTKPAGKSLDKPAASRSSLARRPTAAHKRRSARASTGRAAGKRRGRK